MRRRRWLLFGILLSGLVATLVVWNVIAASRPGISTYHSRKIKTGMTRSMVEDILGGPPGDYRTPPLRVPDDELLSRRPPGEHWQGDRFSVYVAFDLNDRVAQVTGFFPGPMRSSWYRGLQGWIPLPD